MPKKYIVLPAHHVDNALRIPAMWAECVEDVKEAEEIAKKLALKHWKQYTVLSIETMFKPEKLAKKETLV